MRGLVGAAQPFAPDGSAGRFGDGAVVVAGNCPNAEAADGVAAAAGPERASPGNVKAATASPTPTAAYNLERKMNSPEQVMRSQAQRHPRARKDSCTPTGVQKET